MLSIFRTVIDSARAFLRLPRRAPVRCRARVTVESLEGRSLMSVSMLQHTPALHHGGTLVVHHNPGELVAAKTAIHPGSWVELNPQPLPPKEQNMTSFPPSWVELNPQPLPPKESAPVNLALLQS
jgi:hypothetical protein